MRAARHAPFVDSACLSLALSTLLAKAYLVADSLRYLHLLHYGWLLWLPTLFLQDFFICTAIYVLCRVTDAARSRSLFARMISRLLPILMLLVHLLNSIKVSYYIHSGAVLDWAVAMDLMRDSSNWSLIGMGLGTSAALFALIVPLYFVARRYAASLAALSLSAPPARSHPRRLSVFLIACFVFVLYILHRPGDPIWQALERNDLLAIAARSFSAIEGDRPWNDGAWYIRQCNRMRDVVAALRSQRTECPERRDADLSFLEAAQSGEGLHNVVVIVVESLRAQFLPFDARSEWAAAHLADESADITPVAKRLAERGWLFPFTRSVCSYTVPTQPSHFATDTTQVKALIGIFCAQYPLLVNMDKEYRMAFPFEDVCLPAQLARRGYNTAHFQSCEATFDAQDLLTQRFGYANVSGPPEGAEKVNVFGPHDRALVPLMTAWMRRNAEQRRPFLLSFLSNMLHGPHRMPMRYKRRRLAADALHNEYLNTLSHTDAFVGELLREMEAASPGLLNATLVVVTGDHGVALGERGRVNNNENPAEVNFLVPMLFYTENAALRRRLPPPYVSAAQVSAVDLVASVLHLMRLSRASESGSDDGGLVYGEGESVFTPLMGASAAPRHSTAAMQFSLTNPGFHSFAVREGDLKLVFYPDRMLPQIFRLSSDPLEAAPLDEASLSTAEQKWFREMLHVVRIWRERNSYLYKAVKGNTEPMGDTSSPSEE